MTKKQKKLLLRVIVTFAWFLVLLILSHRGIIGEDMNRLIMLAIYLPPYLLVGYDVIIRAAKNISHGQVFDENFLMMVATFAAFALEECSEALAVMLFYQTGELFQGYAVGRSRRSISEMMSIAPEYAGVEREDGTVEEKDPDEVAVGDIIVVRPGERVPLDATVILGESFIDTAALTGESVPRRASVGDEIISGCVNGEGTLKARVNKVYEDSTVSRILEMVENASTRKARLENFITRFAKYYTPVVTIGAALLAVVPPLALLLAGRAPEWGSWITRACIFLIVSCPCALVISVPLGFFGGIGAASRIGVLVKGSNYLEAIAEASTVVMDKTGTLTKGEFKVSGIFPASDGQDGSRLLELAAAGESLSTHPIALSIEEAWRERADKASSWAGKLSGVKEEAGRGVSCLYDGKPLLVGNDRLMSENGITSVINKTHGTVVYVAYDGGFEGSIVISDSVKEGAAEALSDLKSVGVRKLVMLTGDRREAAEAVAGELGIDEVRSELMPAGKVDAVESLLSELSGGEKLAFVGDGINDAPVLMRADVGVAMGSLGSDAAIEAADIVLMDDDVRKIARTVRIGRKTVRIVKQNIVFAIGVKVLVLLLGALGFATMWAAVFADVGVCVIAILNSMRCLKEG